jgi:hypothetical protein
MNCQSMDSRNILRDKPVALTMIASSTPKRLHGIARTVPALKAGDLRSFPRRYKIVALDDKAAKAAKRAEGKTKW